VLHCYRSDPAFVPELDLVMEPDDKLIGQVIYVRSEIDCDDGQRVPIMAFGPISIRKAAARKAVSFCADPACGVPSALLPDRSDLDGQFPCGNPYGHFRDSAHAGRFLQHLQENIKQINHYL
jgi:hypothetical protein